MCGEVVHLPRVQGEDTVERLNIEVNAPGGRGLVSGWKIGLDYDNEVNLACDQVKARRVQINRQGVSCQPDHRGALPTTRMRPRQGNDLVRRWSDGRG